LLDPAALVAQVELDVGALGEHPRAKDPRGGLADLTGEHHRDLLGAAHPDVVGHQGLKECPGAAGSVEHDGARHLDLAHRQLPPIPGGPIGGGEGGWQHRDPAVEEPLQVRRAEEVADLLQPGRVLAGGEPVGQGGEGDTLAVGLALGPLVAVQPDLARIGEVAAQLDEARPELGVEHVEVVDADPPVDLGEVEAGHPRLGGTVDPDEDLLELLGTDDRHYPGCGCPLEIGAHVVQLAVVPAAAVRPLEVQQRDVVALGEAGDVAAEALPDALEQHRRGNRLAQVLGEEPDHLPAHLQLGDVDVEVDTIQALQVQPYVPIEQVVDIDPVGHGHTPGLRAASDPPRGQPDP
jgi:hypothetical protein